MINEQNFVEYDVPVLYKIMTIKQPVDDIALQFWDNLVELYETEIKKQTDKQKGITDNKQQAMSITQRQKERQKQRIQAKSAQLVFAKGKQGMLVIWRFEHGSLISQKSIKISYYLAKQISMIKAFSIRQKCKPGVQILDSASSRSYYPSYTSNRDITTNKFDILTLGYVDGTLQIYEIVITQTSLQLSKCLQIKNINLQPVVKVEIHDDSELFVCRTHSIFMYPKLVVDLVEKLVAKTKVKLNSSENLLRVKELTNSSKLSISMGNNHLHIYNQLEGVFTFSLPQIQSQGSILDSIKCLQQTIQGDMIIASADDCIKIIYSHSNQIEKITGLKSFISSIQVNHLHKQKLIQLWMADYYGQLHYFLKQTSIPTTSKKDSIANLSHKQTLKQQKQQQKIQNQLVMFETQLTRSLKITENGIKKIILANNLLLIVDTQMNLLIYDVVRNMQTLTGRSSV